MWAWDLGFKIFRVLGSALNQGFGGLGFGAFGLSDLGFMGGLGLGGTPLSTNLSFLKGPNIRLPKMIPVRGRRLQQDMQIFFR